MSEPRRHALRKVGFDRHTICGKAVARRTKAVEVACRDLLCAEVTHIGGEPIGSGVEGTTCPACLSVIAADVRRLQSALGVVQRPEIECCGDTSCRCRPPSGVATNGGCRCDEHRVHAALDAWRRYAMELEARVP